MKNLLIYISPTGSFNNPGLNIINDASLLIGVQIENSLALGWKPKDILLYTNFAYKYKKVKAKVLENVKYVAQFPQISKINAIIKLFEKGLIKKNELYWFHDLDAFQLEPITESELELGGFDMGLTDYGRMPRWSTGSIFIKKSSKDIFYRIRSVAYKEKTDEERALTKITDEEENMRNRIKKVNKSYNFTAFNLRGCYKIAIKPIRVAHFHPLAEIRDLGIIKSLDFFKGENKIFTPLITERLVKIFKRHKIV